MKKLVILVILFFLVFKIHAQQAYVNKTYSNLPNAKACMMNDKGYVIATTKNTGTAQLVRLVQLNFNGDTLWTSIAGVDVKKYDPVSLLYGPFGGFAVAGTVYDSLNPKVANPKGSDFFISTFSSNGVNNITRVYGKSYAGEVLGQCLIASNGGYLLTGQAYRDTIGSRFYALKVATDSLLDTILWENTYTASSMPIVHSAISTSDGGLLIGGEDGGGLLQSPVLLKIDANGVLKWKQSYSLSNSNANRIEAARTLVSNNTGYLFIGVTTDFSGQSNKPLYTVGVDSLGNALWKKAFGKTSDADTVSWVPASQAILNSDSTYTIAGKLNKKGFIMRFNNHGDSIAEKLYQRANNRTSGFNGIAQAKYKGYLLCGHSNNGGADSAWVVKVDCMLNDSVQYAKQPNCCMFSEIATMDYEGSTITLCKGAQVLITAQPRGLSYLWSDNSTKDSLIVTAKTSGTYAVTITSGGSCIKTFDPVTFVVDTLSKPSINRNGSILQSNFTTGNKWCINGIPIVPLATDPTYNTNGVGGSYTVIESNACGSDTSNAVVLTGISTLSVNATPVLFYPNPFTNRLFVKYNTHESFVVIQLKDIAGRVVLEQKLSESNTSPIAVNTASLNDGVYLCAVVEENRIVYTQKLIKLGN